MIKEKTMRVGLIAVAAFVLIGMAFVPAVAAENPTSAQNPHYDGSYSKIGKINTGTATEVVWTQVLITYNESTKVLYINEDSTIFSGEGSFPNLPVPIDLPTLFNDLGGSELKNEDVKLIEVDKGISLKNTTNIFSKFTNAEGFNYFGNEANVDLFGTTKKIYKINECVSPITVEVDEATKKIPTKNTGEIAPVGTAVLVDTQWAFEGQEVKIAVQPLQNFGVYGWDVYKGTVGMTTDVPPKSTMHPADGATLLAEGTVRIVKSDDPEDSATTYIITMPAYEIALVPKLRDSGSTFVTYVFLNADSYVLEIPADFALKGIGDSKAVSEKYVELTGCDLLDGHKLTVKMTSEGDYKENGWTGVTTDGETDFTGSAFVLKSIKDPNKLGAYTIGTKTWYLPTVPSTFSLVTQNEATILDTTTLTDEKIYEKLEAKELKTELQFTLKAIDHNQLGKYKDKLTFLVEIGNKTTT